MESVYCSPLPHGREPHAVLIIRMHAVGDVAITLPASNALRRSFPNCRIDFLCMDTCADLPAALTSFNRVWRFPRSSGKFSRLIHTLLWTRRIRAEHYDVIIDLQRNWVTRTIRRASRPIAFAEFNRYAPVPAGERVTNAFREAGFGSLFPSFDIPIRAELNSEANLILQKNGYDPDKKLIVMNPAGLWSSRNWPITHYEEVSQKLVATKHFQVLLLGTERIRRQALSLKKSLGDDCIDLTGKTPLSLAFALVQRVNLVVSDDSGLMHMAWASGVPTIALFGSTNSRWSRPSSNSVIHDSLDLECGACMDEVCKFGDTHCLTRVSPEQVYGEVLGLLMPYKLSVG